MASVLLAGSRDGVLEAAHFTRKRRPIQVARFTLGQYFVHTIGPCDDHAGRNRHTFEHKVTVTVEMEAVNRGAWPTYSIVSGSATARR